MSSAMHLLGSSERPLERIGKIYAATVEDWCRLERSDEIPELWLLPLQLSPDLLEAAATELVKELNCGNIRRNRKAKCVFLFYLLKTRLSNARANRFWPAVSDGISALANDQTSQASIAQYFRQCLDQEYQHQLAQVGHFFKYVYLCFAESGAGADRSRLIKEFFDRLVHRYYGGLETDERIRFCDALLEEHIESAKGTKADIQSLSGLMKRSGYELLAITDELRARPDLTAIRNWNWEKLQDYWKEQANVELQRLLPEAKEVFLEMLPAIAGSVTRYQVIQLIRDGKTALIQPKSAGRPNPEDLSSIAVGPMQIKDGIGQAYETYVRDLTGFDSDRIMEHAPARWVETLGRYMIWRPKPFDVLSSPWRSEKAVPMFAGRGYNQQAAPVGWVWSSRRNPENLPIDCLTEAQPMAEVEIRVSYHWDFSDSGLCFWIDSFSLVHSASFSECRLRVAQMEIWTGELAAQSWVKVKKRVSLSDPRRDMEVCLFNGQEIITSKTFENPVVNGGGLFLNRLCGPEIFLSANDIDRLWLLADDFAGKPKTKGFEAHKKNVKSLMETGLSAYQFTLSGDSSDYRNISLGHRKWRVRVGPFAELVTNLPHPLEYQDIRVVSSGVIQPFSKLSDYPLVVNIPDSWAGDSPGKNYLIINSAGRRLTVDLYEALGGKCEAGGKELSLFELMDKKRFAPAFGLLDITLSGPDVIPFYGVRAFFIDGEVAVAGSALNERSTLTITKGERVLISITTAQAVCFDMNGGGAAKARALILIDEGEHLGFTWQPRIRDFAIMSQSNIIDSDRIALFDGNGPFYLIRIGEFSDIPSVLLNDGFNRRLEEESIDIRELFAEWQPHLPENATDAELSLVGFSATNDVKKWVINFSPRIDISSASWAVGVAGLNVIVNYEALSLEGQVIHFNVISSLGDREAGTTVKLGGLASNSLEITCASFVYEEDYSLIVSGCGTELARLRLPQTPEPPDISGEALRAAIRRIIDAWESEISHALQLLHLYDRFIAVEGEVPLPASKVSHRICRKGMSGTEELAGQALLFLDYVSADREVDFVVSKPSANSELELILATLVLGEQIRLHRRGLMIPSIVDDLRSAFQSASVHSIKKYWSDSMIQLCDSIRPTASVRLGFSSDTQIKAALKRPLVLSDRQILMSLEELIEGRK